MRTPTITDTVHTTVNTLAEDARALFAATAEATDEKVIAARRRLEAALSDVGGKLTDLRRRAKNSVRAADHVVREHPYQLLALALGVGAVIGCLLSRRE